MKKKTKKSEEKPTVNKDLSGFDITINSFGEIISTYSIDELNAFLDKNVKDKKLKPKNPWCLRPHQYPLGLSPQTVPSFLRPHAAQYGSDTYTGARRRRSYRI